MRTRYILIFSLFGCLITAGCDRSSREKPQEGPAVEKVQLKMEAQEAVSLTKARAVRKKLLSHIEVYGSIAQDTEHTMNVTVPERGTLKSFKVGDGDTVDEKTPVAVIETQNQETKEILSPIHGIVMARYVKEGDRVDMVTSIATIVNPDLMRASFDVYEKDLGFVTLGQEVRVRAVSYPGKEFSGKVVFISPRVDETTRTIKIRVDVENNDHLLKFGMFVTGRILKESPEESVVIPLEGIQALENNKVVFVVMGAEDFEVREVKTGSQTENEAAVIEGLKEGEEIVVHGSFILKSELLKGELGGE